MHRFTLIGVVLGTLAGLSSLSAQTLRGGDVIVTNFRSPDLFRIDAAGVVTPLAAGRQLSGPSGIAADVDGGVVLCDFNASTLFRVDPNGALTTVAPALRSPLRVTVDFDGTYLVSVLGSGGFDRVARDGTVTPVLPAPAGGIQRVFDVMVDGDGTYVVCDDRSRGVYRVDRAGLVTPIAVGSPFRLPQGAAPFPSGDYAVFDGLTDSVFRVDRATGAVSTWVSNAALNGNPCGITPAGDGGFFVSMSSSTSNRVVRIDAVGGVTELASGAPFSNLEVCAMVPFLTGPATLTTGPGPSASLGIDMPTLPNQLYALGVSGGLFPGLQLPGDSRALSVWPDSLLAGTLGLNAPPVFTNWFAGTDAQGRGTAGIDLSFLPPGILAGRTLFMQGLGFDPTAPGGIGIVTNVRPLAFR